MVMFSTNSDRDPPPLPPVLMNDLQRLHAPWQTELQAAAARVLQQGWYIQGPEVARFEQAWAAYLNVAHAVGVANGSAALQLALLALNIGPGDEVLTVANAGGYSTLAILAVGAQPVYVDIDPARGLMDLHALPAQISPRSRALVATHLYGRMLDMSVLQTLCQQHGLALVEDAAQAHGAHWQGRKAGSWGDIGCFSFYPTKNLGAMGDAGAVVCQDAALAQRLRQLSQYGWNPKYHVQWPGGINSRMDALQAALLHVLLPQLEAMNARRRQLARQYEQALAALPGLQLCPTLDQDVAHLWVLQHPERDRLHQELHARGIHSDIHYPVPDDAQAGFHIQAQAAIRPALPHTERACRHNLSLPCHPALSDAEQQRVIQALQEILA